MKTVEERFWAKVDKSAGPDGCWLWTASRRRNGYGALGGKGGTDSAHRVSWRLAYGEIPGDMCVLHRCDVRRCVNPAHLFLGDRADNAADRDAKGRTVSMVGRANLVKTQCPKGHPYDERNTYFNAKRGERDCRQCTVDRMRAKRARLKQSNNQSSRTA